MFKFTEGVGGAGEEAAGAVHSSGLHDGLAGAKRYGGVDVMVDGVVLHHGQFAARSVPTAATTQLPARKKELKDL